MNTVDKLPDVLHKNLDLVICGTAASTRSAALKNYYAGPGNKFWWTLSHVGLTPTTLRPCEFKDLLLHGIGLTDVVKNQSGMDHNIDFKQSNTPDLSEKLNHYAPKILCFNGKKAAKVFLGKAKIDFGVQPDKVNTSLCFVAPSTSGAANATWDITLWEQLAELCITCRQQDQAKDPLL